MGKVYSRQPPKGAKVANGSPLGRGITAHFLFNGDFRSAVRSKTGNPVITAGPSIKSGPQGQYAQGNGSGKIVTNLLPSALGVAGSSPRTFIADYWIGDTTNPKCMFSMGDSSLNPLSQTTLLVAKSYRAVELQLYGTDIGYEVWPDGGTAGRVFLAVTYDGNLTVTFRSYARVYNATTGAYIKDVFRTQTTTLPSVMKTGNAVPLNLMGGGTYNFASMDTPLYHLSIYGGRCLTPDEIDRLYRDRHQVMSRPTTFPYPATTVQVTSSLSYVDTAGNSCGAGLAASVASAIAQAYGSSANAASVAAVAQSIYTVTGASQGTSAAAIPAFAVMQAAGASTGTSNAQSTAVTVACTSGSSQSVATLSGNAACVWQVSGNAGGTASVTGLSAYSTDATAGLSFFATSATSYGSSSAAANANIVTNASGSSSGASFVVANGQTLISAVGAALGAANASGTGAMVISATGAAVAASTAASTARAVAGSTANASGASSAQSATIVIYESVAKSLSTSAVNGVVQLVIDAVAKANGYASVTGTTEGGAHYTASGDKFNVTITFAPYVVKVENKPHRISLK